MISLKSRVEIYKNLLNELKTQVDSAGQLVIAKALQGHRPFSTNVAAEDLARDGESLVSADVGSTGSIDHVKEEINADNAAYPTGYMGKSSEITWIQRVGQQLAKEAEADHSPGDKALHDDEYQFETPAYHLDDLSVSVAGGHVDPYLLPDKKTADELINAYFTTFYPSFPIVSKTLFMTQYDTFFETFFPPGSSKRWLAMLNLMLAIGSLYANLIDAEWKGGNTEHLKFFGRAKTLCLDDGSMFEVADLQQVQVVGLTGMYLLASNQTNRSWCINGLAIRFAQTLGLNLRNDVPEFEEVEKELRVRMWFALYSTEHLLCPMTGRPATVQDRDCSVPLPRPIDEDAPGIVNFDAALRQYSEESMLTPSSNSASMPLATPPTIPSARAGNSTPMTARNTPDTVHFNPNTPINSQMGNGSCGSFSRYQPSQVQNGVSHSAAYFLEYTKLNKIISAVLSELYSPDTVNRSWSDIQGIISALELNVVKWKAELPPVWDFGRVHHDPSNLRERMSLAFHYHNTRILINRPCLCRLDYRIPNESDRSRDFNRSAAATCIRGARETVALLPDEPNPIWLFSVAPWWSLLHYMVSAGAILMVEMSMRAEHNPQQADGLLNDAKKIVRWLRAMSRNNIAAERSWAVLTKLLIVAAPKIGGDTSDVERDLGDADRSEAVRQRDIVMQDGGHMGTSTYAFGYPAHNYTVMSPPLGNMAETAPETVPETVPVNMPVNMPANVGGNSGRAHVNHLFHGMLDDPFPFGNIPIRTEFDSLMDDLAPAKPPQYNLNEMTPHTDTTFDTISAFVNINYNNITFPIAVEDQLLPDHENPLLTPQPAALMPLDSHEISFDRLAERTQKRLSLGVSNISMPPSVEFSSWVPANEFNIDQGGIFFKTNEEQEQVVDIDMMNGMMKMVDGVGGFGVDAGVAAACDGGFMDGGGGGDFSDFGNFVMENCRKRRQSEDDVSGF